MANGDSSGKRVQMITEIRIPVGVGLAWSLLESRSVTTSGLRYLRKVVNAMKNVLFPDIPIRPQHNLRRADQIYGKL